mmetsp:Transcript_44202/g.80059  ORF Transcript_44202/g.80059 Transcript_44202/m.80059 type:complete len:266 (-) Transcript_44202:829-1626(-)
MRANKFWTCVMSTQPLESARMELNQARMRWLLLSVMNSQSCSSDSWRAMFLSPSTRRSCTSTYWPMTPMAAAAISRGPKPSSSMARAELRFFVRPSQNIRGTIASGWTTPRCCGSSSSSIRCISVAGFAFSPAILTGASKLRWKLVARARGSLPLLVSSAWGPFCRSWGWAQGPLRGSLERRSCRRRASSTCSEAAGPSCSGATMSPCSMAASSGCWSIRGLTPTSMMNLRLKQVGFALSSTICRSTDSGWRPGSSARSAWVVPG